MLGRKYVMLLLMVGTVPNTSKMAETEISLHLYGLGVKMQGICWFPADMVHIERGLPKGLFITTKHKKIRKSSEALFEFQHGMAFSCFTPQLSERL